MRYGDVELHNVAELLTGSGTDVLPPTAREWYGQQPGGMEAWQKQGAEGLWFTRVPESLRKDLNAPAQINALQTAGGEMRFVLDAGQSLKVTLASPFGPSIAEVYQGDFMVGWHVIGTEPTVVTVQPPASLDALRNVRERHGGRFDAGLCRLVLPWRPSVRLLGIEGRCRPPEPGMAPARRWLAYGSSITHGNQCIHPTGSYAMRTAERLGVDLVNLGLGGGAHLEPQVADHIAGRSDWDFASLEMGVNIRWLAVEEFAKRVEYFLRTIGAAHPGKPVFCVDVFTSDQDFTRAGNTAAFRRVVRRLVRESGRENLIYVNGRRLLRPSRLTADLVHPSPDGMEEMAERLARTIAARIRTRAG
jgi:hypothetical protein